MSVLMKHTGCYSFAPYLKSARLSSYIFWTVLIPGNYMSLEKKKPQTAKYYQQRNPEENFTVE